MATLATVAAAVSYDAAFVVAAVVSLLVASAVAFLERRSCGRRVCAERRG